MNSSRITARPAKAGRYRMSCPPSGGLGRSEIRNRELEVALAVVRVVFERKGEIDRGAMLGNEAFALRRAPGDAAKDPAVLLEGHLQMPVLQAARTIHDLHTAGAEDGTRVAGAKRGERRELGHDLFVDRTERERAVDPEARTQVVGRETR